MRDLTGKVEQVGNGLEQLKQRVEQINSDFDVRFSQMGGTSAASGPPPRMSSAEQTRIAGAPGRRPTSMAPSTVVPPPGGRRRRPQPDLQHAVAAGLGPAASARARPREYLAPAAAGGSINEQFNHAFGLVKQADYGGAETALRAFIDAHPGDPLAGNAHYWLGQTYYARNKFPEAATTFAEGL